MDIETIAAKVAGIAANKALPGSGSLVEGLVGELLDVQDEQLIRLRKIDTNVQSLVDGPWNTGRRYLREACLSSRTETQLSASLDHAQSLFREAADLQPRASLTRASVCLDLALVCALVGDPELSTLYATEGSEEAFSAVAPWLAPVNATRKKVAQSTATGAMYVSLAVFYPLGIAIYAGRKVAKKNEAKHAAEWRARLDQFRLLVGACEALGAPARLAALPRPAWELKEPPQAPRPTSRQSCIESPKHSHVSAAGSTEAASVSQ